MVKFNSIRKKSKLDLACLSIFSILQEFINKMRSIWIKISQKAFYPLLKTISLISFNPIFSVLRECPAYILLYQFSPKDTGQSKVK